jgi:hypothetical protein
MAGLLPPMIPFFLYMMDLVLEVAGQVYNTWYCHLVYQIQQLAFKTEMISSGQDQGNAQYLNT